MQFLKRFQTPTIGLYVFSIILFWGLWLISMGNYASQPNDMFVILNTYKLFEISPYLSHIIQGVIFFFLSFAVTRYFEYKEFLPIRSAIPFFVGLLLALSMPSLWFFDQDTFAFLLFVIAIVCFQELNCDNAPLSAAFNVGFLMTVAALFNSSYWLLFPIFIIGLFVYRLYNIRFLLATLCGIMIPLFIVFSVAFLYDKIGEVSPLIWDFNFYDFTQKIDIIPVNWVVLISFTVLSFVSFLSYYTAASGYKLNIRLNFKFSTLSLVYIIAWIVLFLPDYHSRIMCLVIFINMLLSLYFTLVRNKLSHILFIIFVLLCVVVNVSILWPYSN